MFRRLTQQLGLAGLSGARTSVEGAGFRLEHPLTRDHFAATRGVAKPRIRHMSVLGNVKVRTTTNNYIIKYQYPPKEGESYNYTPIIGNEIQRIEPLHTHLCVWTCTTSTGKHVKPKTSFTDIHIYQISSSFLLPPSFFILPLSFYVLPSSFFFLP